MGCLNKRLNASRPYKHPSVRGENIVDGIIGCEYKTSSWHLNGFPDDGSNIGSQQYNTGEKPSVMLYTYINAMQGHQTKTKQNHCST